MIRCGTSTPQTVTINGSGFATAAKVLVTMPEATHAILVTPDSVSSTKIVFSFVFSVCGTYTVEVTDETGRCDTCPSEPVTIIPTAFECPQSDEFKTLGELTDETAHRLGDDTHAIWSRATVQSYINEGYKWVATNQALFWDQLYLENLPRGFSVTQPWELLQLTGSGAFNYGVGNFTAEFERRAGKSIFFDERQRYGPANHTSPFEATDGLLTRAGASTDIPATGDLPKMLTALDRVSWDNRNIDALEARTWSRYDSRYEITKGEVYGYIWQKDGIRTLRKVRVPAAQCDTVTVTGSWGILRTPSDLTSTTPTGTWGLPRIIEGHHPLQGLFGAPRRVFLEGKNVRAEYFRHGQAMDTDDDVCELPPRYAIYLRDFVRANCLSEPGPGYDKELATLFEQRWQRGVARINRRLTLVDMEHVFVMGGDSLPSVLRPPRPSMPWAYGSRVR